MDSDLMYLKQKVDLGADYIVTQMFFDNEKYYAFVKACRDMGITVPIIPGLKPIYNLKQLTMLPKVFHIDLPTALSNEVLKCKTDEEVEKVGTEWLLYQSKELKKIWCACFALLYTRPPKYNCRCSKGIGVA